MVLIKNRLAQKPGIAKCENKLTERGLAERRIWCLYLGRSAAFLEQEKEQLWALIRKFMQEESIKRNLDSEVKKILFECAVDELEMRAAEYDATFRAYQKSPQRLEGYLKLQDSVKIRAKPLYHSDVNVEYRQILLDIQQHREAGKQEKAIVEFLLEKYKVFPCNCLLHEPQDINYIPGWVAARAIDTTVKDFFSAINTTYREKAKALR